jgi:hypothetical protein
MLTDSIPAIRIDQKNTATTRGHCGQTYDQIRLNAVKSVVFSIKPQEQHGLPVREIATLSILVTEIVIIWLKTHIHCIFNNDKTLLDLRAPVKDKTAFRDQMSDFSR